MARDGVEREMKDLLGTVLLAFERIPDEFVDSEWDLLKRVQFGETLIPNRYKELVGVAVAAVLRCPYGAVLHSEVARLHGATDAEVAEAVHHAKFLSGWSAHMSGLQVDLATFATEVRQITEHLARGLGLEQEASSDGVRSRSDSALKGDSP